MAQNSKDILSPEELTETLAEATETTASEIEEGAEAIEIGPPEEAEIVSEES